MKPTLLVLAAGMGSRYGGLKQLDPMGPQGQTILDYSIRDAMAAGFQKIVFVIRKDFEQEFRDQVGASYAEQIEVAYAFQQLADIPSEFTIPAGRTKPWGTCHAVYAARDVVTDPFAVINADDFYGADAYLSAMDFLKSHADGSLASAMVGYPIHNTLSPHGTVNRGICKLEGDFLSSIEEYAEIQADHQGVITGKNGAGQPQTITPGTFVSMNLWMFSPDFFQATESYFIEFLNEHGSASTSECYLPSLVDDLIQRGKTQCLLYPTESRWFGVTYPEDREEVARQLALLDKSTA